MGKRGFTLVEVLLSVAILATLSTLATPGAGAARVASVAASASCVRRGLRMGGSCCAWPTRPGPVRPQRPSLTVIVMESSIESTSVPMYTRAAAPTPSDSGAQWGTKIAMACSIRMTSARIRPRAIGRTRRGAAAR